MTKARWSNAEDIVHKTFDLLLIAFTVVLFVNEFNYVGFYMSFDYFLAIILAFGLLLILLQSLGYTDDEGRAGSSLPEP